MAGEEKSPEVVLKGLTGEEAPMDAAGKNNRSVTLTRRHADNDDQGTIGDWVSDSGFKCVTIELPWRDNETDMSCVPPGIYTCHWFESPKHGFCFQIMGVPGRTFVEIHAANLAGDVAKGYVSQLKGCCALGESIAVFPKGSPPADSLDQMGVTSSRATIQAMQADMGTDDFTLTIQ